MRSPDWIDPPPPKLEEESYLLTPEHRLAFAQSLMVHNFMILFLFPMVPAFPLVARNLPLPQPAASILAGFGLLAISLAGYYFSVSLRSIWVSRKFLVKLEESLHSRQRLPIGFAQGVMAYGGVPGLRNYAGLVFYDIGFFRIEGDFLHYIGDTTQFTLNRNNIVKIEKGLQMERIKTWHLLVKTDEGEHWIQINPSPWPSSGMTARKKSFQEFFRWASAATPGPPMNSPQFTLGPYSPPQVFGSSLKSPIYLKQAFIGWLVILVGCAGVTLIFFAMERQSNFFLALPGLALVGLGSSWIILKAFLYDDATKTHPQDSGMPIEQQRAALRPERMKQSIERLGLTTPIWHSSLPISLSIIVMMILVKFL